MKLWNKFLLRWAVNALGLWVAANIFDQISYGDKLSTVVFAGLILSLVNAFLKPLIIFLSLPALLLTLGLFMVVVNAITILVMSSLYSSFEVGSFAAAVLAALVVGLVNYLVTIILEGWKETKR